MKSTFKLGAIEIQGLGVVNDIEITQEYSAGEVLHLMTQGKSFVQTLLKEIPEMMLDVEKAVDTFAEIDRRAYESAVKEYEEDKQECQCGCNCNHEEESSEASMIKDLLKQNKIEIKGVRELPVEIQAILHQVASNIARG